MISDVISTDKVTIKPDEFAFTSFGGFPQNGNLPRRRVFLQ
ncbi:MAG: hypothetical protein ACLR8Y_15430 [Alistipes indistinctus]